MHNPSKNLVLILLYIFLSFFSFAEDMNVEGKIINSIILNGLKKAKKKDILATMTTREQMPLDISLIEQDYQNLMALDYFEEIYINTKEAYDKNTNFPLPGMIDLVLDFVEKPTIRRIIFKGNNNIPYGFLIGDVSLKKGDFFNKTTVLADIAKMKERYEAKGFNYINIKSDTYVDEELKSKNQIDLIYVIEEGLETYISEVIIKGNVKYSESSLKSRMKTKERKYFGLQKGIFIESDFLQDLDDLGKYYRDHGFYNIDIKEPEISRYEIDEEGIPKEVIRITITLEEGKQYRYGGMILSGNNIFTNDDLTYNLKLKEGNVFNYSKYSEDKFAIQKKYNDYGYVQTMIEEQPVIDEENNIITYKLTIIESSRSYIEAVYFKNNKKVKNYVLYRNIETEVGQIFDYSRLVRSVYSLMNLGYFSKVEPDIQMGSSPGLLKITYVLEEQNTAEIRFGLQVSTNQWPPDFTVFGEISEKNFLGRELLLSGKIDLSIYKQGFEVGIQDPWFFNFPWSMGASFKFYHEWYQKVLRRYSYEDYELYARDSGAISNPTETDLENYFNDKYSNLAEENPNYIGNKTTGEWAGGGNWGTLGMHSINFETTVGTGYRFLRYFYVSGNYSIIPMYTFLPLDPNDPSYRDKVYEIRYKSYREQVLNNDGWSIKSRLSATFGINTTLQNINPYEGIRFNITTGYTWGSYDFVSLSSKFTAYWKILDMYFNDWPFKQVLVFNMGAAFIFPGFRNIGGELNGRNTAGMGPILGYNDYLTVDGFFMGRGWGNSIGSTTSEGRLTTKTGYARFDFSLEYRIPINEKFVWLAGFVDMVNLVEGPTRSIPRLGDYGTILSTGSSYIYDTDYTYSWMWWNQDRGQYKWYNQDMKSWWNIDNWYGSIGVGVQLTLPQLPLSFYIVKRFKINNYAGFEWVQNSPGTANLDFVLSIVGYYF